MAALFVLSAQSSREDLDGVVADTMVGCMVSTSLSMAYPKPVDPNAEGHRSVYEPLAAEIANQQRIFSQLEKEQERHEQTTIV